VRWPTKQLSSPSGICFAPRPVHTSFQATAHGASHIFCSSHPWDSPLRGFTKDCSRQSFARPKNGTQSAAPLHPAIAAFVHPCTSKAPRHALVPLSASPSRVGASHFLWRAPRLAIPGQSTLPAATDSGAREGYLASRLVGLRPTWAMPGVAGEPYQFPLRPARASQARSDQARRGRPWMVCVGRANGRVGQPSVGPRSAGISGMTGAAFFRPFLLL